MIVPILLLIIIIAIHIGYYYKTQFVKDIKVKKKYIYEKNGIKHYQIMDYDNIKYTCGISLWFINYPYRNLYESIEEDKNYKIKCFGISNQYLKLEFNILELQ